MYPNPPITLQITIPADWPLSPIDRDILTLRLRYALNDPEFWSASDDGDFTTHLARLTGVTSVAIPGSKGAFIPWSLRAI